jgi:hypothetical protein
MTASTSLARAAARECSLCEQALAPIEVRCRHSNASRAALWLQQKHCAAARSLCSKGDITIELAGHVRRDCSCHLAQKAPWLALSLGALSALGEGQEFVAERKSPRRRVVDLARETKLGSQVLLAFDDHEVVQLLRAAIAREESQTAYARRHGLERTGLNLILRGKRPVSDAVMKALGLRKVYVPE